MTLTQTPARPPLTPAAAESGSPPRRRFDTYRAKLNRRDLRRAIRWLTKFSWPRSFPIVQFPNAPLALAFIAGQAAQRMHGAGHADSQAISYLAMAIWAYEELFRGVNWFRRLLGLAYIVSTAVHLAHALH
jgi:hypothetical protein